MYKTPISFSGNASKQSGSVLTVSLILLVVMLLVVTSSFSRVNTSERLAISERDSNSAFQAAEAALLEGERWITQWNTGVAPVAVDSCPNNDCSTVVWRASRTDPTDESIRNGLAWSKIAWETKGRALTDQMLDESLIYTQPRYVIEELAPPLNIDGNDLYHYRVTSRANGSTLQSEVILQSVFRRAYHAGAAP